MRIQHNIMAMNSYRNYNINTGSLGRNLEKLSSGYKINRAGDDAAGLAISEKMRAQISGLKQAQSNVKDGISLVKTAEGALQEVQDMLNRMSTLATQSANGTYDDEVDRTNLQKEVTALLNEIDRIADSSNFNGIELLDGTQAGATVTVDKWGEAGETAAMSIDFTGKTGKDLIGGSITIGDNTYTVELGTAGASKASVSGTTLKVGKDATASTIATALKAKATSITAKDANDKDLKLKATVSGGKITFKASKASVAMDALSLPALKANAGLNLQIGDTADTHNQLNVGIMDMHGVSLFINDVDVSTQEGAAKAVSRIKNAINMVSSTRGDLGAIQNRLEHTTNNLAIMTENIQDAESTIRDVDIADEMTSYTKNNILLQSAQAMLAQANQMPQGVLQLLQ